MTPDWTPLDAALERRAPTLWWRDDDAVEPTPALDRLLALAASLEAPLTLASIPARTTAHLAHHLRNEISVTVAVHGWAHHSHAPCDEKNAEFGPHRPLPVRMAEAGRGLRVIGDIFADRALPVFIPPWNRLAPDMPEALAQAGFHGLSVYGERAARQSPLPRFDAHLDPIDWRGTRSAVDPTAFIARIVALMEQDAPIGLMTHHLVHDEAIWNLVEAVVIRMTERGARWVSLKSLVDASTAPAAR